VTNLTAVGAPDREHPTRSRFHPASREGPVEVDKTDASDVAGPDLDGMESAWNAQHRLGESDPSPN
jgi:hypothetical protein